MIGAGFGPSDLTSTTAQPLSTAAEEPKQMLYNRGDCLECGCTVWWKDQKPSSLAWWCDDCLDQFRNGRSNGRSTNL